MVLLILVMYYRQALLTKDFLSKILKMCSIHKIQTEVLFRLINPHHVFSLLDLVDGSDTTVSEDDEDYINCWNPYCKIEDICVYYVLF